MSKHTAATACVREAVGWSGGRGAGFTLIELMVAMLLGLIVIAGAGSVFLASSQTYRTNEALSNVQTDARVGFQMLASDVRDAGLLGCNNGGNIANVLRNGPNNSGTTWWANWGNAVHGYDSGQTDPATGAAGSGKGDRVDGTDSLQLLGAKGTGLSVDKSPAAGSATFTISESKPDLTAGDVIIVCDPNHAALTQVTSYDAKADSIAHDTSKGVSPGNCSKGLGFPTTCTTGGNPYIFQKNALIAKMTANDWYIGNYVDSDGNKGRSLYRVQVHNSGGTMTATREEMVRNVTNMQIMYHQQNNADFVDASKVSDWGTVDAVQIQLTMQSTNQRAGTDAKPISRTFTSTTTLRNRVN